MNNIVDCYKSWGESYYDEYYKSDKNYPPVHVKIVKKILKEKKIKTLLDVGCGPVSMMREIISKNLKCYGFDLTPEMILEGKKILRQKKRNPNNIWIGDALAINDYKKGLSNYQSCLCFGVFPHINIKDEKKVLKNIFSILKKNGLVLIEARNSLFSLFTINRYTSEFYREELISNKSKIKDESKNFSKVLKLIDKSLYLKHPKIRKSKNSLSGYDEILSKTNNPFVLTKTMEKVGFKNVTPYFYHYHIVPPIFKNFFPKTFIQRSLEIENPKDWRGYFLASAFILVGEKK